MCGIFGILNIDSNNRSELISRLVRGSTRRGKDACGLWFESGRESTMIKKPVRGERLLTDREYKEKAEEIGGARVLIGQTRLATNGSCSYENNQPIKVDELVLVHNGIIVNDKDLSKKLDIDWSKDLSDSGVVAYWIKKSFDDGKSWGEMLGGIGKELWGTYNLAVVKNDKLCLISNNGSLYWTKTGWGMVFASEKRMLVDMGKVEQVVPGKALLFDIITAKVQIINFKTGKFDRIDLQRDTVNTVMLNHKIDQKLIDKIKRCKKCILPVTTPQISFDDQGICNFCNSHKQTKVEGLTELKKLANKYRSDNGSPDCILAFSGGRDSSYGLHYLVKELGMHPVAVTFDWGMLSDLGRKNQALMLGQLGVEQIVVAAEMKKARGDIKKNLLAWLKKPDLGMVPLLMQGDKTTEYYVDKIKKELGVKLVFFCRGNELEREEFKAGYCGVKNADPGGVIHNYSWLDKGRLLLYYLRQFVVNPAYINSTLWSSFLGYLVTYIVPHNYVYLWHFIKWDERTIIDTLTKKYGWLPDPETGQTWRVDDGSPAFYNYVYYQLQGFTENDSFRSNQIREGVLSRDRALKLVKKENKPRYGAIQWYLDTVGVDADRALTIIDETKKRY